MSRLIPAAALIAVMGMFAAGVADGNAHEMGSSRCRADIKRLCHKTPMGEVASCLKQHMSELSPACKAKYSK
ncbi:hypothetical protein [Mesorhizobium sp.]|uniref:hypothetical protein n=1 Tax=Mesorhizobium sp. TaxID=1871066 RepID=UPI003BAD7B50